MIDIDTEERSIMPAQKITQNGLGIASNLLNQVEKNEVCDDDTAGKMTELAAYAKGQKAQLEKARKTLVKPLNDHVKMINAEFKNVTDQYEQVITAARAKISPYMAEKARREREERERQERERAEAEATRQAEIAAEAARLAAEKAQQPDVYQTPDLAEQAAQAEAEVTAPPPPPKPKKKKATAVKSASGTAAATRQVWAWEIEELDAVPREFLIVDSRAISQAVKAGERQIAGVRIFQKDELVIK